MHLRSISLEKPTTASNEQGVTSKHDLATITTVLHEVADRVLRVAGGVECCDGDVGSDFEGAFVGWCARYCSAVFAANYGDRVGFELIRKSLGIGMRGSLRMTTRECKGLTLLLTKRTYHFFIAASMVPVTEKLSATVRCV